MTTTIVTLRNETAIEILCMPRTWPGREEGEVLTPDGYFRLDELYKDLPSGSPQHSEPQPDRYLKIGIGDASGDICLTVALHAVEPPLDLNAWDSIEQAGAEFTFPEPRCMNNGLYEEITALRPVLADVPRGWNMIRASRRGVHPEIEGAVLQVDIWPINGPADLQRIKHQPAPMPTPRRGSFTSATGNRHNPISFGVLAQWEQLTRALWRAGDLTVTVRDRSLHPDNSSAIEAVAQTTELTLTPLLREWFLIQDCYPAGRWANLFPNYMLLTPEQAGRTHQQLLTSSTAVTAATTELPSAYIPIATGTDTRPEALLIADLDPGKNAGTIREIGGATTQKWRSPAHLTRELADAIEYRRPFLGHLPDFSTHTLQWKAAKAVS